jgi:ketosteroid isomerase-like protein
MLAGVLALPLAAAAPDPAAERAVLAAERAWVEAMVQADAAALAQLLSGDLVYSHSSGRTETKAEVLQVIGSRSTRYESIVFRDTKLRQYGDVMIVTEKAALRTTQSGALDLYVTHVWVKGQGAEGKEAWRMVSRQATRLAP